MIEKSLLEKIKCTDIEAKELAGELKQMKSEFQPILNDWLADRSYKDVQIKGISIQSLMDDYNLEFTGALLTLDWLSKDYETAIKALKYGIR